MVAFEFTAPLHLYYQTPNNINPMSANPIEEYEVHAFYPTRFFRFLVTPAVIAPSALFNGNELIAPEKKVLQQKWRNIQGAEEWRDVPEVVIPEITSIPLKNSLSQLGEAFQSALLPTATSGDPTSPL